MKQFAPACERNKEPIRAVFREILPPRATVLEIGSGSGQHAAYFAAQFPQLQWYPSDVAANLPSINAWREEAALENLHAPVELDLSAPNWPDLAPDVMVCINTIHIISWPLVEVLFEAAAKLLKPGALLYVYGPYRYRGHALAPSNEQFDLWLKQRDRQSGIRVFEDVDALAQTAGLRLQGDKAMPANNRSIWWRRE